MLIKINETELNLNVKLGVTIRIKTQFKKTYNQVVESLESMDTVELIDLLYCGLTADQISKADFTSLVLENWGMGDLLDHVTDFIKQIQYPGMSNEEIEKKLMEKREQANKYR